MKQSTALMLFRLVTGFLSRVRHLIGRADSPRTPKLASCVEVTECGRSGQLGGWERQRAFLSLA